MLTNIETGWNGITKRDKRDIAVLVSSCSEMRRNDVRLLYTDRHAYTATARWSANEADLPALIDWGILRGSDFTPADGYPDKKERYHVPYIDRMITSRLTTKAQTTIPQPVRAALNVREGDVLLYAIEGDRVILTRAHPEPTADDPFATFVEWDSEADRKAYAGL